jgi:DNA polymerase-1
VHCDIDYAVKMGEVLSAEVATAERLLSKAREVQEFERKFGRPFAVNDDDVVRLLRDVMHRNEGARGDGYSGDEAVLSSLPASAGIAPQQILAVRGAQKLLGTYVLPLQNKDRSAGTVLRHDDGLIHTNYNLMLAITGRLSSDEPNLQNYPKRKRREVRGVIVAPAGHVLGAFDYGQIEARVIAMASEDKALVDAMWTSYDIHKFWAERFVYHYAPIKDWIVSEFEVDWDEKGIKTLRQEAKNKWVFPMFFGSSHRSCAKGLHVPEDVAETIADEFWDTFAGVKKWQQRTVKAYEKNLYVETLTGRRRRGPTTLNELINTPIQGTAADIVLDAQNRLSEYADASMQQQFNPPINVHDDLSFYIPRATMVEDMERIAHTMCDSRFPFINVPIVVEASISQRRWHELSEIGVYRSDELGYHKR